MVQCVSLIVIRGSQLKNNLDRIRIEPRISNIPEPTLWLRPPSHLQFGSSANCGRLPLAAALPKTTELNGAYDSPVMQNLDVLVSLKGS